MVDGPLTACVRGAERRAAYGIAMETLFITPFITGRAALSDADRLMRDHGDEAGFEAAIRAEHSRDAGNVVKFCHWRQIERVIATLASDEVAGTIH